MDSIEEKKRKKREYNQLYRKKNIDKIKERELEYAKSGRKFNARNNEISKKKRCEESAKWYQNNKEKRKEYNKQYREIRRSKENNKIAELSDPYIIKVIKKASGYTLKKKDILPEKIEIKRVEIIIKRIVKHINTYKNGI